ncbi:MAG: hypothetical protein ACR2NR_08545, partial [Solirubrobacteraceae bacterium]
MLRRSPPADRTSARARRTIAAVATACACAALVAAVAGCGDAALAPAHPAVGAIRTRRSGRGEVRRRVTEGPASAQLTIGARARLIAIPRSFLGLSTEYWSLPRLQRQPVLLARTLALLHVRGDGPFVLRVSGDSADHSFWDPRPRPVPHWAFGVTPPWLHQLRRLVRRLHLRLIVDLNLITDSPGSAARWAQAIRAGLPRGTIAAFEVGNEPDIYDRPYWRAMTAAAPLGVVPPRALTARDYATDFRRYAAALSAVAPHVPLAGPALANPKLDAGWVSTLLDDDRRSVGMITAHAYPHSACAPPGSSRYPTIPRLLSRRATAGMTATLRRAVRIAHAAGVEVRLTEINSVTCGGRPGVSDAFASALWAPGALFDLIRAGIGGVNVHVRAGTINAPFTIGSRGLVARPLLYGLVLFARTLGARAALAADRLRAASDLHLAAWGVAVRGHHLHVLLIGPRPR